MSRDRRAGRAREHVTAPARTKTTSSWAGGRPVSRRLTSTQAVGGGDGQGTELRSQSWENLHVTQPNSRCDRGYLPASVGMPTERCEGLQ